MEPMLSAVSLVMAHAALQDASHEWQDVMLRVSRTLLGVLLVEPRA